MQIINTPHGNFTSDDERGLTAEEVYAEWKKQKEEQIDIPLAKTTEEKLEELVEQVTIMDELIANIMMEM